MKNSICYGTRLDSLQTRQSSSISCNYTNLPQETYNTTRNFEQYLEPDQSINGFELNRQPTNSNCQYINVCLIGNSGAGKSTLGNELLCQPSFATSDDQTESQTKQIEKNIRHRNGVYFQIIDTPGFFDTHNPNDMEILTNIQKGLNEIEQIHLFVWCYNINESKLDRKSLLNLVVLKNNYGDKFTENLVIIFTHVRQCQQPKKIKDLMRIFNETLERSTIKYFKFKEEGEDCPKSFQYVNEILDLASRNGPVICFDTSTLGILLNKQKSTIQVLLQTINLNCSTIEDNFKAMEQQKCKYAGEKIELQKQISDLKSQQTSNKESWARELQSMEEQLQNMSKIKQNQNIQKGAMKGVIFLLSTLFMVFFLLHTQCSPFKKFIQNTKETTYLEECCKNVNALQTKFNELSNRYDNLTDRYENLTDRYENLTERYENLTDNYNQNCRYKITQEHEQNGWFSQILKNLFDLVPWN